MTADILSEARDFAVNRALTPEQARLFDTAFMWLRTHLVQSGSTPDSLDCVAVCRWVYGAVTGGEPVPDPLPISLIIWYLGVDLLDDLMDRELPPVWSEFHPSEVWLAAATMISTLPQMALCTLDAPASVIVDLQRMLAHTGLEVSAGQQTDVTMANSASASVDLVEASVSSKSGAALSGYAAMAARLAGASEDVVASYAAMGRAAGTAWQVRSDCFDALAAAHSKDLANGTRTLPIVLHLEELETDARTEFLALLDAAQKSRPARDQVRARLRAAGVLRPCALIIESCTREALEALKAAAPSGATVAPLREFIRSNSLLTWSHVFGSESALRARR